MKYLISAFYHLLYNSFITFIPSHDLRNLYIKLGGGRVGKSRIDIGSYIRRINCLKVGNYTYINRECILDAAGGLIIGDRVSISYRCCLMSGSHDVNSLCFAANHKPILIKDYAWIGVGATILGGVTVGEGAVIAAGSVVTKDVEPYTVVGGIPARFIANRQSNLNYKCYDARIRRFLLK